MELSIPKILKIGSKSKKYISIATNTVTTKINIVTIPVVIFCLYIYFILLIKIK